MSIAETYPHQAEAIAIAIAIAIAKLLAGTCPGCNNPMPPVPLADIEECLDDTGGEIGHMCDACFVEFMAGSGWDLSCFERFTPEYVATPEKRAFIALLDGLQRQMPGATMAMAHRQAGPSGVLRQAGGDPGKLQAIVGG